MTSPQRHCQKCARCACRRRAAVRTTAPAQQRDPTTMAHSRRAPRQTVLARGFSLVEVLITRSIIGIVLAIGVPIYRSAVANARVSKATDELRIISQAIG